MDTVDKTTRSRIMSSIRSVSRLEAEAKPMVGRIGKQWGMTFRHQPKGIVGRPDFANKSKKVAIFVHGCFFHSCPECRFKKPKTNVAFWKEKFRRNRERHDSVVKILTEEGWVVILIWEHEIRGRR